MKYAEDDNLDLLYGINEYADNLCDYLSNEYGYCLNSFKTDLKIVNKKGDIL